MKHFSSDGKPDVDFDVLQVITNCYTAHTVTDYDALCE